MFFNYLSFSRTLRDQRVKDEEGESVSAACPNRVVLDPARALQFLEFITFIKERLNRYDGIG